MATEKEYFEGPRGRELTKIELSFPKKKNLEYSNSNIPLGAEVIKNMRRKECVIN